MTAAPAAAAPAPKVKAADNAVLAPVDGAIKPITEVPDKTFAAKILGDGFAVVPTSGRVVAPVAGKITRSPRPSMQWASPLPPEWKCSCTSAWILYSSPDPRSR